MNTSPLAIPAQARAYVYWVFGLASLGTGATQVAYAAAETPNPTWLTIALAVVPFVGAGIGWQAATHTPTEDVTVTELDHTGTAQD